MNILLISPKYFDYELKIKAELEKEGNCVDWLDDRPKCGTISKGLLRLFPSLMKHKTNKYFNKIVLKKIKNNNYDICIVILGQSFSVNNCLEIKKHIKGRMILYLWDSIKNFPNCLKISKCFDTVFSFDYDDCERYNFHFLPLFFSETINEKDAKKKPSIFISFIGTIKKGKYEYLKPLLGQVKKYASENNLKIVFYMYLQSKLVYIFYKVFYKEFRSSNIKEFDFKKLSYDKYIDICKNSNIILDVVMGQQNGLTMRTFEAIGLNKKLITTNKNIDKYEFYNKDYILIYDRQVLDFNDKFFMNTPVSYNNKNKYTLSNWVKTILD